MHTVLITGASGVVAKAVGGKLVDDFEVIGVSRSVEDEENFTRYSRIDLLDEDDLEELEGLLEDVDCVLHFAWNVSVENFDTGERWPENIEMFENVVERSRKAGVEKFVNGSSIHAGTGEIPAYKAEASLEDTPEPYRKGIDPENSFEMRKDMPGKLLDPRAEEPDSPYGESKIETEKLLREKVDDGAFELGVSIRIGGINSEDSRDVDGEPYYSSLCYSHKDIGTTIRNIIRSDETGYHQFYGVSDNRYRVFNIENSFTTPK